MNSGAWHDWNNRRIFLLLLIGMPIVLHLLMRPPAEPVFNGDENRHVMTSVFFHDFLTDLPWQNPKSYAENYYEQYPALGLLIWPPLFHAVTGATMLVAGLSVWVPRIIVLLTAAVCVWLIFRMGRRRDLSDEGLAAGILFAVLPLSFTYSRYVMLELPTLCLCLLSIERFDAWLHSGRTTALYVAAAAAAAAALTRFDAVVLLPTLVLMALFSGQVKRLLSWHTIAATVVAAILTGPTYFLIWKEMGDLHVRQATESVSGVKSQFLAPEAWSFYPSCVPEQATWLITILAIVGLPFAFQRQWRSLSGVFASLWLGTYLTFTPLAELASRHAIYWLPAISWFAVLGILSLAKWLAAFASKSEGHVKAIQTSQALAVAACLMATGAMLFSLPDRRVQGYQQAAVEAMKLAKPGQTVFLDAWWEGNFIYQLRRLDSDRQRSVVRGNRLLYDFTNVPKVDLTAHVETDDEMLQAIAGVLPSCIVLEGPQPFEDIPMAKQLRQLVFKHPDLFPQVKCIPVDVQFPGARQFSLYVFDVDEDKLKQLQNQPTASAGQLIADRHNSQIDL